MCKMTKIEEIEAYGLQGYLGGKTNIACDYLNTCEEKGRKLRMITHV